MTTETLSKPTLAQRATRPARLVSIDAMRGFVMFIMIFVNDIAGVTNRIIPWWMKHYSEMTPPPATRDGMTFVDLVFPAFLFIVGMSIPFALGSRLKKGEPWHSLLMHIITRTLSLLLLGMLLASGTPTSRLIGYPGALWVVLMLSAMILSFCQFSPAWISKDDVSRQRRWRIISLIIRCIGFAAMLYLMLTWRKASAGITDDSQALRIVNFSPFSIDYGWWEILGRIGWAYFMGSLAFLIFRYNRLALALCATLMLGLWYAQYTGSFSQFALPGFLAPVGELVTAAVTRIHHIVEIGETLGARSAITVSGVLLATILITDDTATTRTRIRFTLWFIATTALAAMIFYKPYLIWKNNATPAFCLWACSLSAATWLLFFIVGDTFKWNWLTRPFAVSGQNVLLAYLLSRAYKPALILLGASGWYNAIAESSLFFALARAIAISALLLAATTMLNRTGFRLKL